MGLPDDVWDVLLKNPLSTTVVTSFKYLFNSPLIKGNHNQVSLPGAPALGKHTLSKFVLSGNIFVRLAGLSGATAVILGAYGAHSFNVKSSEERKRIYETANTYHFIHSLALLGTPLCRFPVAAGSVLTVGMLLFCITCYYEALTEKKDFKKITPIGGICLIFGWICLIF